MIYSQTQKRVCVKLQTGLGNIPLHCQINTTLQTYTVFLVAPFGMVNTNVFGILYLDGYFKSLFQFCVLKNLSEIYHVTCFINVNFMSLQKYWKNTEDKSECL